MKQYISTNWKKILFIICGLVVAINLVLILVTPNNVINDYYKYGPVYSKNLVDINADGSELIEKTAEETGTSFDTAKIIIVFAGLLVGCLILDDIMQSKEKKK